MSEPTDIVLAGSNSLVANETPADLYHRDPCPEPSLSSSVAKVLVTQSPLHAWSCHPKLGGTPRETTQSMTFGTLIHAILLGAGPKIVVVDADDFKTKAARAARDEALELGQIPITKSKFEEASAVSFELIERFRALGLWPLVGEKERVLTWQTDGIWCRAMLDCLELANGSALITDLKSTADASPKAIARSMVSYGYDIQQTAYVEGVEANYQTHVGRVHFRFVFFELSPPFAVTPAVVAGTMRELGEKRWGRAKKTWRECLATKTWPGYAGDEPERIEAPPWALSEEMEREYGTEL